MHKETEIINLTKNNTMESFKRYSLVTEFIIVPTDACDLT